MLCGLQGPGPMPSGPAGRPDWGFPRFRWRWRRINQQHPISIRKSATPPPTAIPAIAPVDNGGSFFAPPDGFGMARVGVLVATLALRVIKTCRS